MKRQDNNDCSSEEEVQTLMPSIIERESLIEDENLPILTILNVNQTNDNLYEVVFEYYYYRRADIYLYSGENKIDMHYQVLPGVYRFRKIVRPQKSNKLEIFYSVGNRKSTSSFFTIKKE